MGWWSRQAREIRVAIITGVLALTGALGGVAGTIITDDPPPKPPEPEPGYCIKVLNDLENFLEEDPRNTELLFMKDTNGMPVIRFDRAALDCGVNNRAIVDGLAKPPQKP
jgi:hypothetical protein